MGPKASTVATNQDIVKINHQRFNNTKFIKGQNQEQLISITLPVANQKEYQTWAKRLTEVPNSETLMLPVSHQFKKEGFCGSSGLVNILYDNFPFLLSDQISNRQCLNKKLFEQNQLWYLVYTLLSSSECYHSEGRKIGDIRPDNIFINEDGQVKVATQDSWPGQQTNYSKSFYQKQFTYLSPQQIKDYQFGKMEESANFELAQTFSIGLTCLDAATLSDSKNLYSKNFKFDYNRLQQKLKQFKMTGYSKLLTLTIQNMCEVDAQNRSKCRQILNWLKPHEQAIVNLEDFQVNGVPQKMLLAQQKAGQSSQIGSSKKAPIGGNSPFIQQSGPFTYQQYVPGSISTYQQPVKVSQYYPPPSIISGSQGQPQAQIVNGSTYQINNPSYNAPTGYQSAYIGSDDHKSALEKIDEQLNLSRKMFPS